MQTDNRIGKIALWISDLNDWIIAYLTQGDQPEKVKKSVIILWAGGRVQGQRPRENFESFTTHYNDWKLFKPPLIDRGCSSCFLLL